MKKVYLVIDMRNCFVFGVFSSSKKAEKYCFGNINLCVKKLTVI